MKSKFLITALSFLLTAYSVATYAANSHSRKGYVTKNGSYVEPSRATNPNKTQRDNYSSKPNINPYNGKEGKREPQR